MHKGVAIALASTTTGLLLAGTVPGLPGLGIVVGLLGPVALTPLLTLLESLAQSGKQKRGYGQRSGGEAPRSRRFAIALGACLIAGAIVAFAGMYWLPRSLQAALGVHASVAWLAFVGGALTVGLHLLLVISPFIVNSLRNHRATTATWPVWALAVIGAAIDAWLRSWFPWSLGTAVSHYDLILQLASVIGEPGLSFFPLLVGGCLARVAVSYKGGFPVVAMNLGTAAVLWLVGMGLGYWRQSACEKEFSSLAVTRVAALTGSISPSGARLRPLRNERSLGQVLGKAQRLAAAEPPPELLVVPSGALRPNLLNGEADVSLLKSFSREFGVPLLVTTVETEARTSSRQLIDARNVSVLVRPDTSLSTRALQVTLAPLVQNLALSRRAEFFLRWWPQESGDWVWQAGSLPQPLPYHPDFRVLPLIEFDVFGRDFPKAEVRGTPAGIFAVVANLNWTDSPVARGFLVQAARLRAIEERRSTLVVANGGPVLAFDPAGEPVAPKDGVFTLPASTELRVLSSPLRMFGTVILLVGLIAAVLAIVLRVPQKARA